MSKGAHKQGGFQRKEVKEFDEEVLEISRVTRVVKGGRKLRFRATVAIGNRKNKAGLGIGKSNEVTGAIQKAISQAKKDMITITLDGSTISHDIRVKYKAAKLYLKPAAPGTGIIAGGTMRKVLDLAGIKDILSKSFGTTNKICNARATLLALKSLKDTPVMQRRASALAAKKAEAETKAKAEAPKATKPTPKAPTKPESKQPIKPLNQTAATPKEKSPKSE
ncbi:MAG: 30S ribosomal protein S5 [Candidatus Gracilibacteria bacterium]|nr:30S ribosomal protein S5 [Candidatus Gracilibacteria bacterium]